MKYKHRSEYVCLTFLEECPKDGKFYITVSYEDEDDDNDAERLTQVEIQSSRSL